MNEAEKTIGYLKLAVLSSIMGGTIPSDIVRLLKLMIDNGCPFDGIMAALRQFAIEKQEDQDEID